MKVSNIMQTHMTTVSEDTPLKVVARYIFTLGISAVPVLKDKKLVGIVSETDILRKLYPTMEELAEDYIHLRDFEQMERNLTNILDIPVKKFMNSRVTTVSPETPIMNAQSKMLVNEFSHLPVVDEEKKLLGMVSQGDIFRRLIKNKMPELNREQYADFIAQYYDGMVDWNCRFKYEFPEITKLFSEEKIKSIVDFGSWTGEYAINLAKKGKYNVVGLDHNPIMVRISNEKKDYLPPSLKENINFYLLTEFKSLPEELRGKYDAVICMGNSLPYFPVKAEKIFKLSNEALKNENALLIVQVLNFDKILKSKSLLNFEILKSGHGEEKENLFIEFFEKKPDSMLMHHVILFENDGKNWIFKGITSIEIHYFTKKDIQTGLKNAGFKNIHFSGSKGECQGEFGKLSFNEEFNPDESDWLIAVAKR